jgi:hypothetical protein
MFSQEPQSYMASYFHNYHYEANLIRYQNAWQKQRPTRIQESIKVALRPMKLTSGDPPACTISGLAVPRLLETFLSSPMQAVRHGVNACAYPKKESKVPYVSSSVKASPEYFGLGLVSGVQVDMTSTEHLFIPFLSSMLGLRQVHRSSWI